MMTNSKDTTQENTKTGLESEETETSSPKMKVKKFKNKEKSDDIIATNIEVENNNNNNKEKNESNEDFDEDELKLVVVDSERPKLADGFFEIEAVRRKRVRKGEIQYLIKWRGWPETANTWEPFGNLQSCSDVIDAFEDSLHSGKQKKRKRKHKDGITQSLVKKTQQQSYTKVIRKKRGQNLVSANGLSVKDHVAAQYTASAPERPIDVGFMSSDLHQAHHHTEERREENGNYVRHETLPIVHIQNGYDNPANGGGIARVKDAEPGPSTKGSRRRKPKSVKRFRRDSASNDPEVNYCAGNTVDRIGSVAPGSTVPSQRAGEIGNALTITEIIRPYSFSASASNNVQDVDVKFVARSSDGAEVVVDNKYLKHHNPLLLISYYESHLMYSPSIPI